MFPELKLRVRVRGRHPQFFRKMIHKPASPLPAGGPVFVRDRDGKPVGVGFYNPRSELALRMLSREPIEGVDACLSARVADACALRDLRLRLPDSTDGYRLIHAEGDRIPGLILDRLGRAIVAQVHARCITPYLEEIGEQLLERYPGSQLLLTVDAEAAMREGIDKPPRQNADPVAVTEHGIRFTVHPGSGHKTGFFADQRENRQRVRRLAAGRDVLDLFCNSGGFALAAQAGGARRVRAVDLDESMVEQASANAEANRMRIAFEHADAFDVLKRCRVGTHDLIVLDPPKWARGKDEVDGALTRYHDLNRLAFEKLPPGGLLVTCSCSGALGEHRFLAMLADAAAAARRDARVLFSGGAGPDHPVALECPETRYLKVVILEVC
ncbi:MAG: class I SAM-dependent rRNA methyltransferase [Planctomycetes bacterium]|nr:class I SAM-dependent rRNA methyltransferase [Planctomycetota bacterium]MCB9871376.1 class I SAM-dependent rRNA methyltransferase [Planctomycetota bacterium]MCB9888630.1 class I SAM-dependent rRNA methyltransferase [Planctomycetota bacterium]